MSALGRAMATALAQSEEGQRKRSRTSLAAQEPCHCPLFAEPWPTQFPRFASWTRHSAPLHSDWRGICSKIFLQCPIWRTLCSYGS